MQNTVETIQIGSILVGLFGGLALFLYGLDQMTDALKMVAGGRMKDLLSRMTTNRFKATLAGAFVTAIIQSSSVTTVLVVGFVSAGLLTLRQSIGIIMGAEIGTTITAQIIALKVTQYALVLVAVGFALYFLAKRQKMRQYGLTLMGLGLIFFGMNLMSEATTPLRTYAPFITLMQRMDTPLLAILVSALFTALIQSSSATIGIIIVLAGQGFISLEAGIALTFGANIGTSITALLASLGKPTEAVQTAYTHILFNLLGVVLWFSFIDSLATLVRVISPSVDGLNGTAKLAAETPRQIANAHTIFNTANAALFIWFTSPLARLVQGLFPARLADPAAPVQPQYLDEHLLETPALALDRVRLELGRLGQYTLDMVHQAMPTVFHGDPIALQTLAQMDEPVDVLYGHIVLYLRALSKENMFQAQSAQLTHYMTMANDLESIGDMIQTNLVEAGEARLRYQVQISEPTQAVLQKLNQKVCWAVEGSIEAIVNADLELAQAISEAKTSINQLADAANRHLTDRLTTDDPNRLDAFRIESELIEYLKRVYYFAKRIAREVIKAGQLPELDEIEAVIEPE